VRGDRDGSTLATVKRSQAIAIDFALRERLTMVFMPSTALGPRHARLVGGIVRIERAHRWRVPRLR
jgi:hypothetical protein